MTIIHKLFVIIIFIKKYKLFLVIISKNIIKFKNNLIFTSNFTFNLFNLIYFQKRN